MTEALGKLQELLKELFQIENATGLDFGIYRIMNQKRSEVSAFVDDRLPEIVAETLNSGALSRLSAQAEERRQVTDQIRENFGEYAINSSGELNQSFHYTPLGQRYLALPPETPVAGGEQLEASIFNHLYTFFGRYYDNGDFLSRRRYSKREKYVVPYNGEEVYLHWANSDQYYIKTGSYFLDYNYDAPNGIKVRFKVVSANVEHDNVKETDRRFVPRPDEAVYDEEAVTLTIPFDWRTLTDAERDLGKKQTDVDDRSEQALLSHFEKYPEAHHALSAERSEDSKGNPVSYLEYHLRRYTGKNTSDFFIHKDLQGFLERELDFYLKNEVLDVDDLERWMESGGQVFVAARVETLQAMKKIGRQIITFLAQIEDFQKKLFEKKKFVVSTGYCITLDKVHRELYEEITENDAQYKEWQDLFHIDEIPPNLENGNGDQRSIQWLEANPYLVLDTKFFSEEFEDRLLSNIEDLDEKTDGLLINSENFQALNLLQDRYRDQVKCIYIDPPYNTGGDGFLYKDSYQHSSWMTMMEDRLRLGRYTLAADGVAFVSIDDNEQASLKQLMDEVFHPDNFVADVIWQKKYAPQSDAKWFSDAHDFLVCHARNRETWRPEKLPRSEDQDNLYSNPDADPRGPWMSDNYTSNKSAAERPNLYYPITNPNTGEEIWPSRNRVWGSGQALYEQHVRENRIWWGRDGQNRTPRYKRFLSEVGGIVPRTVWTYRDVGHNQDALRELRDMFGDVVFTAPKPTKLIGRVATVGRGNVMLDYFAGSGTTGHAAINLNRKDGGRRKYILVDMGEFFDTVLKPRIQKVIYSKDWKDGKPESREGTSQIFKYMTLESYEDALNNISFGSEGGETALDLYGDEYLLRYMLDFETRNSETLLNIGEMTSPFDYKLALRDPSQPDGETRQLPVDLPETFAYLLGMRVHSCKAYHDDGRRYLVYRGATHERNDVAVIWRDTTSWEKEDYERDRSFVAEKEMAEDAKDVFVNGESLIPTARSLESTFKKLMLAGSGPGPYR